MSFLFTYLPKNIINNNNNNRTFVLAEVLNAWSALEVFVISIIAALLEISQFASFIVGDDCDPINKVISKKKKELIFFFLYFS